MNIMKNLEQELKNYYKSKRLRKEKVREIRKQTRETYKSNLRASYLIPLAASILLAIGILARLDISGTDGEIAHQIAAEIRHNHRQHGDLLVESDHYGAVQEALSELAFLIKPRRETLTKNFILIGGKYCVIQSSRAAQLKLRHRGSGIVHTLYVLPVNEKTENIRQGTYETDGVNVELWTDQSLLYGLAHSQ